jgi:hypothetical protein
MQCERSGSCAFHKIHGVVSARGYTMKEKESLRKFLNSRSVANKVLLKQVTDFVMWCEKWKHEK